MTHGNPIVNANGVELKGDAPSLSHRFFDQATKILQVDMTGDNIHVRVDDGDEGLGEIFVFDTGGFE